eukprot:TRINITY_DN66312_c8_g2_i1.p4 TRINITY_DN66312_c8_g2~~TRINITY_DN66312_c8_g2_i1.p4  ORF type:complete len:191 (-),score=59.46 TRINITY_DN66312_c8_g2_i1:1006-1578(-)
MMINRSTASRDGLANWLVIHGASRAHSKTTATVLVSNGVATPQELLSCTDADIEGFALAGVKIPIGVRRLITRTRREQLHPNAEAEEGHNHGNSVWREDLKELGLIIGMLLWGVGANYVHLGPRIRGLLETSVIAQFLLLVAAAWLTVPEASRRQVATAIISVVVFFLFFGEWPSASPPQAVKQSTGWLW